MRNIFIFLSLMIVLNSISIISAIDTGEGMGISVTTQKFAPKVFLCQNRTVIDDPLENGVNGLLLTERKHNYAFEGESISWLVFVMDKNKIEDVKDVVGTIGQSPGPENDVEVECKRLLGDPFANSSTNTTINVTIVTDIVCSANEPLAGNNITCSVDGVSNSTGFIGNGVLSVSGVNISFIAGSTSFLFSTSVGGINGNCTADGLLTTSSRANCSFSITNIETATVLLGGDPFNACNARIDQYNVTTFDPSTMAYYNCRLTVETPMSMHGEYFLTVEAKDGAGLSGIMAESEYWFLNPTIALSVDGALSFEDVMPGTDAYSKTIIVGGDAEAGSGVMLDMFISGTDFYDLTSSGTRCSDNTNKLSLNAFRYFVTNGAYDSLKLALNNSEVDKWGYTTIPYGTEISASKRIMRFNTITRGVAPSSSVSEADWNNGNVVSSESEMALTFRLSMPEPCIGDFTEGQIYFWGEAI